MLFWIKIHLSRYRMCYVASEKQKVSVCDWILVQKEFKMFPIVAAGGEYYD